MKTSFGKGIHFILLLGIILPLSACQPFGGSDDDKDDGDKTEQEEKDKKDNNGGEGENKSEKDN